MEVTLANFGPIASAQVRLRPLTIFIGRNNSGKSYLAMLIYSLSQAFQGGSFGIPYDVLLEIRFSRQQRSRRLSENDSDFFRAHQEEFSHWLMEDGKVALAEGRLSFHSLPASLQQWVRHFVDDFIHDYTETLAEELRRCFAADMKDLVTTYEARARSFTVGLRQEEPAQHLVLEFAADAPQIRDWSYDIAEANVAFGFSRGMVRALIDNDQAREASEAWWILRRQLAEGILTNLFVDVFRHRAFYVPAARSGILQSHRALASFVVQQSSRAGIRPFEIPQLSGVIADFISLLLIDMSRERPGELAKIAAYLEQGVIDGKISLRSAQTPYPEIVYQAKGRRFPLHRTSSMISELAPVVLLLKTVVHSGDLLIIEEPESHLHPAMQRKLAMAIARMIRKGVRVLLTTHSDYFLTQLSNCVRRSRMEERGEDYLLVEEVGAYLFAAEAENSGSTVRELSVTDEEGIAEDSFAEVAEELYEETVELQEALPH